MFLFKLALDFFRQGNHLQGKWALLRVMYPESWTTGRKGFFLKCGKEFKLKCISMCNSGQRLPEEKLALVSKLLAGESMREAAIEAGMDQKA